MKKNNEILVGIVILIVGFVLAIVVALVVVESSIPSNASNDGWLGFLGGLFGSFISGMITFWVLYINRKDIEDGDIKKQKISEMDKMGNDLKETFGLLRRKENIKIVESYFSFIYQGIPEKYRKTLYATILFDICMACAKEDINKVLGTETLIYIEFFKYKKMYIEGNETVKEVVSAQQERNKS